MKVTISGKPVSTFKALDFKDRETGEVISEGKTKLQLSVSTELSNGSIKLEIIDISIPDDQVKHYESQIGKEVQVTCSFISKSPVSFYVK